MRQPPVIELTVVFLFEGEGGDEVEVVYYREEKTGWRFIPAGEGINEELSEALELEGSVLTKDQQARIRPYLLGKGISEGVIARVVQFVSVLKIVPIVLDQVIEVHKGLADPPTT